MLINLTIRDLPATTAASYNVQYARVDNVAVPIYTSGGSFTAAQLPYTIPTPVPNGQYIVTVTPIYADGRVCPATPEETPGCQGITQLNAVQVNNNLQITYVAPGQVPQVFLTVDFPNGGTAGGAYTNGANNNTILISIPPGVVGNYLVYMQSICDTNTNFYSSATGPVIVPVGFNTVNITSSGAGIVVTEINGISGYALSAPVSSGGSDTGTHGTFTGAIALTFTGTPSTSLKATLTVNGSLAQCVNLPNTNGGTVSFTSATYYSTDVINVSIAIGSC